MSDTSDASNVSLLCFSLQFPLTPPPALSWCDAAGSFRRQIWHEEASVTNMAIRYRCLRRTRTHGWDQQVISQFAGSPGVIPAQFTDISDTGLPTCPLLRHALLASYEDTEMKTNTVGFVLLQKAAALNLHGSSPALPPVPVEAGRDGVQIKAFKKHLSPSCVLKDEGNWVRSSPPLF